MKTFKIVFGLLAIFGLGLMTGQLCGVMAGKVTGCEIAYRDLYKKLDLKAVDQDSLHKFCLEKVQ